MSQRLPSARVLAIGLVRPSFAAGTLSAASIADYAPAVGATCTISVLVAIVSLLRLKPDAVSWREVDGEVLALDHGASAYLATNESGALLWKSLVEGTSREALVELLVAEFEVDEARATADVDHFLSDLAAQGLLAA